MYFHTINRVPFDGTKYVKVFINREGKIKRPQRKFQGKSFSEEISKMIADLVRVARR